MIIRGIKTNFDHHSWMHFVFPLVIAMKWGSWKIAFAFVIGTEILDVIYHFCYRIGFRNNVIDIFLDKRGISWGDLVLGMLAVTAYLY